MGTVVAQSKSVLLTVLITVLSIFFLIILIFPWTNFLTTITLEILNYEGIEQQIIIDAIISFIMLCIFFLCLTLLQKVYVNFIILISAITMFLIWGVESKFFWNGLNPMYPAWFEINMAINDIVAALLVITVKKRITFEGK